MLHSHSHWSIKLLSTLLIGQISRMLLSHWSIKLLSTLLIGQYLECCSLIGCYLGQLLEWSNVPDEVGHVVRLHHGRHQDGQVNVGHNAAMSLVNI